MASGTIDSKVIAGRTPAGQTVAKAATAQPAPVQDGHAGSVEAPGTGLVQAPQKPAKATAGQRAELIAEGTAKVALGVAGAICTFSGNIPLAWACSGAYMAVVLIQQRDKLPGMAKAAKNEVMLLVHHPIKELEKAGKAVVAGTKELAHHVTHPHEHQQAQAQSVNDSGQVQPVNTMRRYGANFVPGVGFLMTYQVGKEEWDAAKLAATKKDASLDKLNGATDISRGVLAGVNEVSSLPFYAGTVTSIMGSSLPGLVSVMAICNPIRAITGLPGAIIDGGRDIVNGFKGTIQPKKSAQPPTEPAPAQPAPTATSAS